MRWFCRFPVQLREQPFRTSVKAIILASVVVFLPFLLFSGINQYFADLESSHLLVDEQREMLQILSAAANRSEPESLFTDVFSSLVSQAYPGETFNRRLDQIASQYGHVLDLYVFDENDRCLSIPGFPVPPRYAAQKFLESLKDSETVKRNERFLIQLSGYRLACKKIADSPGRIISIGSSHDRYWGGFFGLSGQSGEKTGSLPFLLKRVGLILMS